MGMLLEGYSAAMALLSMEHGSEQHVIQSSLLLESRHDSSFSGGGVVKVGKLEQLQFAGFLPESLPISPKRWDRLERPKHSRILF